VEIGFVEPANATSFTIPYNMYQGGSWKFDLNQIVKSLRKKSVIALKK